jgi:hypothetical protein
MARGMGGQKNPRAAHAEHYAWCVKVLELKAHRWGDKTKGGYRYLSLIPAVLWVYSTDVI